MKLEDLIPGRYYKYVCNNSRDIFYFQFKKIENDRIIGVDFLDIDINYFLPRGSLTKEEFICCESDISNIEKITSNELLKYYNIAVFDEYYHLPYYIKTTLL